MWKSYHEDYLLLLFILFQLQFMLSDSPLFCRETCQGQAFVTASTPPIILFLEITFGGIGGIPQIFSEKHKFANIPIFVLALGKCLRQCICIQYLSHICTNSKSKLLACTIVIPSQNIPVNSILQTQTALLVSLIKIQLLPFWHVMSAQAVLLSTKIGTSRKILFKQTGTATVTTKTKLHKIGHMNK